MRYVKKVTVHGGLVWVVRITRGWYTHLKAFPVAMDEEGQPVPDHPEVLAYFHSIP